MERMSNPYQPPKNPYDESGGEVLVRGTYSVRDHEALARMSSRHVRGWFSLLRIAFVLGAAVAVVGLITERPRNLVRDAIFTGILTFVFGLISWAYYWTHRRLRLEAARREYGLIDEIEISFLVSEQGVTASAQVGQIIHRWSDFTSYRDNAFGFLLRNPESNQAVFIPRRWCSSTDCTRLKSIFAQHLSLQAEG